MKINFEEMYKYDGWRILELKTHPKLYTNPIHFDCPEELIMDELRFATKSKKDKSLLDSLNILGKFYQENSNEDVLDSFDFILYDQEADEVYFWSDEGPDNTKLSLENFVNNLISPKDKRWKKV